MDGRSRGLTGTKSTHIYTHSTGIVKISLCTIFAHTLLALCAFEEICLFALTHTFLRRQFTGPKACRFGLPIMDVRSLHARVKSGPTRARIVNARAFATESSGGDVASDVTMRTCTGRSLHQSPAISRFTRTFQEFSQGTSFLQVHTSATELGAEPFVGTNQPLTTTLGPDDVKPTETVPVRRVAMFNYNVYAQKKSAANGLMDLALLMANASQLKHVLAAGSSHRSARNVY